MALLAKQAGISRATLYRHLGNRQAFERKLRTPGAPVGVVRSSLRARVLSGAHRAIATHGLLGVTIEQIAEASGVGEASIYRTFKDKDTLLRAAFDELPVRRDALALLNDLDAPVRDILFSLARGMLEFAEREPETLRLIAFGHGAEARYVKRLREGQTSAIAQLVRYLMAQQRRGRLRRYPAEQLAASLVGLVYASSVRRSVGGPERRTGTRARAPEGPSSAKDLDKRAADLVDLFLHGATGRR
jgi:AcrR family transcriptional regulator